VLVTVAFCLTPLSLDEFMSFPNRGQLVMHPKNERLAWVSTTAGVTNIFGMDSVNNKNVFSITNNTDDGGMAITNLQFVGDHLLYTYGPDEDANPRHNTAPRGDVCSTTPHALCLF
jgi:hypothetical protein